MSRYSTRVVSLTNGDKLTLTDTDTIDHELAFYDSGVLRIIYSTYERATPNDKREIKQRKIVHLAPHAWVEVLEDWS